MFLVTDSLVLEKHLEDAVLPNSCLGSQLLNLHMAMQKCSQFDCGHVFREANQVAHGLAKFALPLASKEFIWIEEVPHFVHSLVIAKLVCH